jgi:ORF6N domain
MMQRDAASKYLPDDVARRIYELRGQRVMLDAELAGLYGVGTKTLTEASL